MFGVISKEGLVVQLRKMGQQRIKRRVVASLNRVDEPIEATPARDPRPFAH